MRVFMILQICLGACDLIGFNRMANTVAKHRGPALRQRSWTKLQLKIIRFYLAEVAKNGKFHQ